MRKIGKLTLSFRKGAHTQWRRGGQVAMLGVGICRLKIFRLGNTRVNIQLSEFLSECVCVCKRYTRVRVHACLSSRMPLN